MNVFQRFISRVTYREDLLTGIRSSHILFRQTLSISSWLPILEKMNTFYIKQGSLLNPSRFSQWKELSATEKEAKVELYLIKWKNLSYIHCSWENVDDLTCHDGPHMKQKFQVYVYISCNIAILP